MPRIFYYASISLLIGCATPNKSRNIYKYCEDMCAEEEQMPLVIIFAHDNLACQCGTEVDTNPRMGEVL